MTTNSSEKTLSVVPFLVRNTEGKIDRNASFTKFQGLMDSYLVRQESDDEVVSVCLHALFDAMPKDTSLNQDYITSTTVGLMSKQNAELADPKLFAGLRKRVKSVLDNEIKAGKVTSLKGPGGGVRKVY